MTQSDLAAVVGVDIATISNTERGVSVPDFATIESVADILVVSLDDLVGRDSEWTKPQSGDEKVSPFQNPWPTISKLQAQLDKLTAELRTVRNQPAEGRPKPTEKGRRTA